MARTEVKVNGASVGSLVAGMSVAVLNAIVADSTILGGAPGWFQFVILAVAPTLVTWLSGYATPSTTSRVSDAYTEINRTA